jgi:hypothetical protein
MGGENWMDINLKSVFLPSEDIVAREIEGELIIVPLVSGIGEHDDELFTLSETGREIWNKLDGRHSLNDVIVELSSDFKASEGEIEKDVIGFVRELASRNILVFV